MKFRITLKDPDGVYDGIRQASEAAVADIEGLDSHELEAVQDIKADKIAELTDEFFEYGEYCTIEFDMDKGTAKVVRVNE